MDNKEIELYREEILELTELLKTEWLDLKELLQHSGLDPDNLFLISYCEDEKQNEFGVLFTNEKKVVQFEIYGGELILKDITGVEGFENEFPQIKVVKDYF